MNNQIYLRPLKTEDALISYQWRNNAEVWKYTGSKPDREITPEIETAWLTNALKRENEKRFAICLAENDRYIGNAQLTHITKAEAQYHIFIGETNYWGKGIATQATNLLMDYAFGQLALKKVYLEVSTLNMAAITAYKNAGFTQVESAKQDFIKMEIKSPLDGANIHG